MRQKQVIIEAIEVALAELRPYLEQDGGDLEFVRYEEETQTAEIRMLGNCKKCPMHLMTFRAGIERYVINKVPEVRRLEEVK